MVKRNSNIKKLLGGYLFPEIAKRKKQYLESNPEAKLINLGIGDTTYPIPSKIANSMAEYAKQLSTYEGYSGYGAEQGSEKLRKLISHKIYQNTIPPEDIFISDGCKCDLGRLQIMFGKDVSIAVQDPAYPVYVDTSVMMGQTGNPISNSFGYEKMVYMPCIPENNFFPDLQKVPKTDIIFITSPNNPTGTALTKEQLKKLIAFAKENKSFIVYDAAYSLFINDTKYPKSIFEIPEAKDIAIELNSFSKIIGFTGVRLGWSVVPEQLKFEDGTSVKKDWNRIVTTFFNGASNIAQMGGIAALEDEGLTEIKNVIAYYMKNTKIIKDKINSLNIEHYGGENAPYIWAKFPKKKSWDVFNHFLHHYQIVVTPGSGFGPSGEEFIRLSAFGSESDIQIAMSRLKMIEF